MLIRIHTFAENQGTYSPSASCLQCAPHACAQEQPTNSFDGVCFNADVRSDPPLMAPGVLFQQGQQLLRRQGCQLVENLKTSWRFMGSLKDALAPESSVQSDSAASSSSLCREEHNTERSAGMASTSEHEYRSLLRHKSAKRKAAEALLAARHSQASACNITFMGVQHSYDANYPTSQAKRQCSDTSNVPVHVKACDSSCTCSSATGWCHFDVKVPHVNWQTVFEMSPMHYSTFLVSKGFEKVFLPEGLQVYIVENHRYIDDALAKLRASMQDNVVAIDLEWRPERAAGQFNPVALMQLSSATVCVLIRTSSMAYQLPDAVKRFLGESNTVVVGFSWNCADEQKMVKSFDFGRNHFKRFVDLQTLAKHMGYQQVGLAKLVKQVIGFPVSKAKAVSMSDWAARALTMQQVKYAALDAFVTGQVFRSLRLWHTSPSLCSGCKQPIGAVFLAQPFEKSTDLAYSRWNEYYQICMVKREHVRFSVCNDCGRVHPVEPFMPAVKSNPAPVSDGSGQAAAVPAGAAPQVGAGLAAKPAPTEAAATNSTMSAAMAQAKPKQIKVIGRNGALAKKVRSTLVIGTGQNVS